MLSQVKRRLLYPILSENRFITPSVVRFSSKKGSNKPSASGKEEKVDSEIPKDIQDQKLLTKKPKSKTSDEYSEVFDAVLQAAFSQKDQASKKTPQEPFVSRQIIKPEGELNEEIFNRKVLPKKLKFKDAEEYPDIFDAVLKPTKEQKNRISRAKPGNLNLRMAKAANNVAGMAGEKKEEVLGDIMDKLNTVFPGMENHVKGKRKLGRDKRNTSKENLNKFSKDNELENLVGLAVAQKGPSQQKPKRGEAGDKEGAGVIEGAEDEDFDAILDLAFSGKNFSSPSRVEGARQPRFVGQEFSTIDQLLKSQQPLGLFTSKLSDSSTLSMWAKFEETQLQRCTSFEPLNWFDQCIAWTNEGKLWHFPIDNEQGMEKEAEVDFTEHIFLDHHIEPWCPKEGPIKYFMELVLVGLSKNPYLTVQEKKETLDWYRDYFKKNQSLLEEINAFGSPENTSDEEVKMS